MLLQKKLKEKLFINLIIFVVIIFKAFFPLTLTFIRFYYLIFIECIMKVFQKKKYKNPQETHVHHDADVDNNNKDDVRGKLSLLLH